MSVNDLSRAVALRALAAEVSARLQLGEQPGAIRAALLAEGYPPEVVDHVLAVCEGHRSTGRRRTLVAAGLSAVLLIGLPLAGAVGGAWAAVALMAPEPNPDPDDRRLKDGSRGNLDSLGDLVAIAAAGFLGIAVGVGLGLGMAIPVVNALSAWSIDGSITDDAVDE